MEEDRWNKTFSRQGLLLVIVCLALNVAMARLTRALALPVYFDAVGTILAGALGGYLPAILVGFFSNAINAVGDPITLYYGLISVLFGLLSAFLSLRGWFQSVKKSALAALLFALTGGGLGSVLTWLLNGLSIGSGVSSPYAVLLNARYQLPPFYAQLAADFLLDLLDKTVTMVLVFLVLRWLPARALRRLPLGLPYLREDGAPQTDDSPTSKDGGQK